MLDQPSECPIPGQRIQLQRHEGWKGQVEANQAKENMVWEIVHPAGCGQENCPVPVNTFGPALNSRGSIHDYFSTKLLQAQSAHRQTDPNSWTNELMKDGNELRCISQQGVTDPYHTLATAESSTIITEQRVGSGTAPTPPLPLCSPLAEEELSAMITEKLVGSALPPLPL
jgi:hypothetical protein